MVCCLEQTLGGRDPQGDQILGGRGPCVFPEAPRKPAHAKPQILGVITDRDRFTVIFMKIVDGSVHLSGHVRCFSPHFFFAQAAEHDEEQMQPVNAGVFIVRPAFLQFADDLLEDMRVLQRRPAVDDMFSVLKTVLAQDIGDIVACKMNPEHLRVISSVVIVPLLLPGTVEDHVPGGDDVFLPVKVKMSLSGSDIEQLEIHPPPGPVGRHLGEGHQSVGAAASYEERVLSVLKINP